MPYTTSTATAGEIMRRLDERCTFRKSFNNDGIGRDGIFVSFLQQLNIPYNYIPNHAGISIVEVTCRTREREFIDRAADIVNRESHDGRAHDWRRYMQASINDSEQRSRQMYENHSPSEFIPSPQQVNTLSEEGL